MNSVTTDPEKPWRRFLLVTLPLALLAIALIMQILAWLLSAVTPRRHTVDDLAAAAEADRSDPPVVLLGDSAVHNVSRAWRIGEPGQVADLSSHGDAGLVAELLLLKRYIAANHHPRTVLLVATPDVFAIPILPAGYVLYVQSTFTRPDEIALLAKIYPDNAAPGWRPAAMQADSRIAAPLFSLLRHGSPTLPLATAVPQPNAAAERLDPNDFDPIVASQRNSSSLAILPPAQQVMRELCAMSLNDRFTLQMALPPTAPEIMNSWRTSGAMARFTAELQAILSHECNAGPIVQLGLQHDYRAFDRSSRHVRGRADEQEFAIEVATLIAAAAAAKPSQP